MLRAAMFKRLIEMRLTLPVVSAALLPTKITSSNALLRTPLAPRAPAQGLGRPSRVWLANNTTNSARRKKVADVKRPLTKKQTRGVRVAPAPVPKHLRHAKSPRAKNGNALKTTHRQRGAAAPSIAPSTTHLRANKRTPLSNSKQPSVGTALKSTKSKVEGRGAPRTQPASTPTAMRSKTVGKPREGQSPASTRKALFLARWRSLSPGARRAAIRRVIARRSFPRAAHLAVPAEAEVWLHEQGEVPQASSSTPHHTVLGGDENVVFLDAPVINKEELKERDARIAMRLLMSQHFRVDQRSTSEEMRLRKQKLEEVTKPLLERDYQKRLNTQTESTARWKRSPQAQQDEAYRPEHDTRIDPVAVHAFNAFGGRPEAGYMHHHYDSSDDSMSGEDSDGSLFFSHPPSSHGTQHGSSSEGMPSGVDDGSVLLQPPTSHLFDTAIPVRMFVDEDDFDAKGVDVDDTDSPPSSRRDRGT